MKIQTSLPPAPLHAQLKRLGPWFYEFEFSNGVRTESSGDNDVLAIHESRARCILPYLDRHFEGRWQNISCLDVACHEGWFALQVAQRGARFVRGIDLRPERIQRANLIREAGGFSNVIFEVKDLFALDPPREGTFDLVLFLGIFYHLEDIVRGFRLARALTREVCVVEGQVARHSGEIETAWGKQTQIRSGPACVVIESDPEHARPGAALSLVPSLPALQRIVRGAGFERIELVEPTPSLHEQYRNFDRVLLFAFAG